jgi:hypothetical protein
LPSNAFRPDWRTCSTVDGGAQLVVDDDVTAVIGLNPGVLEAQSIGRA